MAMPRNGHFPLTGRVQTTLDILTPTQSLLNTLGSVKMNNTGSGIKSATITAALPTESARYYVDNFSDTAPGRFDLEHIEVEADMAAAHYCMEKRAHRAQRAEKIARKTSR